MRSLILFAILPTLAVMFVGYTATAQDQSASQDIRMVVNDYVNKAKRCQHAGDSACSAACVEAINLVRNGPSSKLDQAAETCNSGFAAIQSERSSELAQPTLQEGFAWMPDIEATVIRARGAPFLVEGRDHDWDKHCTDRVRFGGASNDEESKKLIRSPGTKVILKHVQYPKTHVAGLGCVIGDVVAK